MIPKAKARKTARAALHQLAKRAGATAASKNSRRPSTDASSGTKTAHAQSAPEGSSHADSSSVGIDRAIADCVSHRIRCTVRIRPLPSRCRLPDILALCPSAVAARLPWNPARRRHKGVAFLEFACPDAAAKHAKALAGSRALGGSRELATSVRADDDEAFASSCADAAAVYSRSRVVVSSLGDKATPARLMELAPAALDVRFPAAGGMRGRGAPRVAVVTFADAWQALDAVRSCQGAEVAGSKTSWMLEKMTSKPKPLRQVDKRTLVLSGVTNAMRDSDLLRALPLCSSLERCASGTAVALYAAETDCAADLAALASGSAGTQLRATYGHRPRSSNSASRISRSIAASVLGSPHSQSQRVRLLAVGLPAGTKKAQLAQFLGDSGGGLLRASVSSDGRLAVLNFASREGAEAARARFRGMPFGGVKVRTAFSLDQLAGASKQGTVKKAAKSKSPKKKATKKNAAI